MMAKLLAGRYSYSSADKDGNVERKVAEPGTDVSKLPKEVQDGIKNQGVLVVDSDRLNDSGAIAPAAQSIPRYTPTRTPQSQVADAGRLDMETRRKQAEQIEKTGVQENQSDENKKNENQ